MRVTVVVVGDLGNSPRMQYHALALATTPAHVDLIGTAGTPVRDAVATHPRIRVHRLPDCPSVAPQRTGARFAVSAAWRAGRQCGHLLSRLLRVDRPDVLLVQSPPAVPTLAVVALAARLRGAALVIDWHNLGYAMLALRLGGAHRLVRLARWYEGVVGRWAARHLTVSRALQAALEAQWGIAATVLYDQPLACQKPLPLGARRALFERLRPAFPSLAERYDPVAPDRPALLVAPSGWTADDDFALLLAALDRWDARADASASDRLPDLCVLATGRGPLRPALEEAARSRRWRRATLHTGWVPPDDYPRLLGAADLGLCLHRSASGLDLPMKITDMFGAGLPVCALAYGACLDEQIRAGETGVLFADAAQLVAVLAELLRGFPRPTDALERLRQNVAGLTRTWDAEWNASAAPLLSAAICPTRDGASRSV